MFAVIQRCPSLLELRRVMCISEQFQPQAPNNTLRCSGRKRPVFGQKTCGFQSQRRLPQLPGGPQLYAQCQRTARGPLWQLHQAIKRSTSVAVIQCPARCPELHTLPDLLRITRGRALQSQMQMLISQGSVLQRLRAFSHQQMRQRLQLAGPRSAVARYLTRLMSQASQTCLLRQCISRRLGRTDVAPSQLVGQCVHQCAVHGALFLLCAPASGFKWQAHDG